MDTITIATLMKLFEIPIDINLNVLKFGQSLSKLSSKIILELEKEFILNK